MLLMLAALAQSVPGPPPVGVAPPPPPPPPNLKLVRTPNGKRYYPARERKAKREGTTDIGLVLRNDGRIARCRVTASSGSPPLDAAACRLGKDLRFEVEPYAGRYPDSEFGCCLDFEVKWGGGTAVLRRIYYAHPPLLRNANRLIGSADYPAAAMRAGEAGTVAFDLSFDSDGKPNGCTVVESSGSARLDSETCRLATARAQAIPARNRYGDSVPGTLRQRVIWRLGG